MSQDISENYARNFLKLNNLYAYIIKKKRNEIIDLIEKNIPVYDLKTLLDVGTTSSNQHHENQFIKNNILEEFKKHGVNYNKIVFEGLSPRSEYFDAYNAVDIALDTFPCNGGITSFESAFMGVPVLTMENNNSYYLRIGESINNNQNVINWIAKNENDYITKAVKFAENKKYLSKLKKEIKDNALKSPLFDAEEFVNDFYEMLLNMLK